MVSGEPWSLPPERLNPQISFSLSRFNCTVTKSVGILHLHFLDSLPLSPAIQDKPTVLSRCCNGAYFTGTRQKNMSDYKRPFKVYRFTPLFKTTWPGLALFNFRIVVSIEGLFPLFLAKNSALSRRRRRYVRTSINSFHDARHLLAIVAATKYLLKRCTFLLVKVTVDCCNDSFRKRKLITPSF